MTDRPLGPWAMKVAAGGLVASGIFVAGLASAAIATAAGLWLGLGLLMLGTMAWLANLGRALQPLLDDEEDDLAPDALRALIATVPIALGPAWLVGVAAERWSAIGWGVPFGGVVRLEVAVAVTVVGATFGLALILRRHRPWRADDEPRPGGVEQDGDA